MKAIAAMRLIPPTVREFDIALHRELEKLSALWKGLMFNESNERVDEKEKGGRRRRGTTRERKCYRYKKYTNFLPWRS